MSLAGIIASDSLKGFISGTHYNRCKRIHSIFAAAMEILHFNAFLCLTNTETELLSIHVKQVLEMIDEAGVQTSMEILPPEILDLCSKYAEFIEDTKRYEHGKIARYWMQYIEMVHLYHDLSRSVHESDLEMFIHSIPKISCYFFAFN